MPPDQVKCRKCELNQVRSKTRDSCRRCGSALPQGEVQSTTVVYVSHDRTHERPHAIRPLREVMREACVEAVTTLKAPLLAAKALGITHTRMKQLLREAGHTTDYRKLLKKERQ